MVDERHEREIDAALRLIQSVQARSGAKPAAGNRRLPLLFAYLRQRFIIEGSLMRLACEGVAVFILGIFVGLGLYTFYEVIREALLG